MDASHLSPILAGLVIAALGFVVLTIIRRIPPKTPQSGEALLRGRPAMHVFAIFAMLVGVVLVVARLA